MAAFREASGHPGELYVRLQVSRGAGAIGLDVALADGPSFVLLVQPCPVLSAEKARDGLRLSIANDLRRNPAQSLDPAWKTGNYLNNLLGLREARARGADEVLMLNLSGEITEAAVSNVAFIRGGTLETPPLSAGILSGITRRLILEGIAAAAGLGIRETPIRPEDLSGYEECMLLSTTRDVVPVGSVDGVRFRLGPDTAAARLKAAFADYGRRYAASHPQLRVF